MNRHRYIRAHWDSELGDPNYADKKGYVLVGEDNEGLMIYRRKWWNFKKDFNTW